MLYRYVFITHSLSLILCGYQHFVQILSYIRLATLNLNSLLQCGSCPAYKMLAIDFHLLNQLQNQTIINGK